MPSARITTLRVVGLLGAIVFGGFFAFTFSIPGWVEDFAADFIEREVSRKIDRIIDSVAPPSGDDALSRFAGALYKQKEEEIERLKTSLKNNAHEKMADAIAEVRNLDCECRKKYEKFIQTGFESKIQLLQAANDKIVDFIQSKYMDVVNDLKRDIRIFTGSNAGMYMLLVLISFLKPKAVIHLFLPAILLFVATLVCSYFYIFEQNWLMTIIYSDYLGFVYLAYLGIVFGFLLDIFMNRARITTQIINAISHLVGSALSVDPCG
ncbi:MAG: hypothetical protein ACR2RB_06315 [Gammaproteobacteria bacterium]